jgi:hypothetical protein
MFGRLPPLLGNGKLNTFPRIRSTLQQYQMDTWQPRMGDLKSRTDGALYWASHRSIQSSVSLYFHQIVSKNSEHLHLTSFMSTSILSLRFNWSILSLRDEQRVEHGFQFGGGTEYSLLHSVQTFSEAQPASYPASNVGCICRCQAARAWWGPFISI